jgi:hypothetical protein
VGWRSRKRASERIDKGLAEKALAEANCQELYRLFEKAVIERGEALKMIGTMAGHYLGENRNPLYQPPSNAIESMEKVSLAAIQLSRDVALKGK